MAHRSHAASSFLMLVLLGTALHEALAHGGGLHRWTLNKNVAKVVKTAAVRTYLNTQIATCSKWTTLNYSAISPASYAMPYFPPTLNMSVSGAVDVYEYLSTNCTSSANTGLFPFLRFSVWSKLKGKWTSTPAPNGLTAFAYGFQGSCSAPGNLYRNNATLQDNRFNLAWWGKENVIGTGMNASDLYPGYMWGSAPQSWFTREPAAADALRSIVIMAQSGPSFCCNVDYTGFPAPKAVLKQGVNCATAGPAHYDR